MSNLIILDKPIRAYENLYSLNELHQHPLVGAESKYRPTFFLRLDTTKDLIAEMQSEGQPLTSICVVKNGLGSYACEELVLAYAMWISPKFHLIVLRAFIAMHRNENQQQQLALPDPEPLISKSLTKSEWLAFVGHWYALYNTLDLLAELEKPLQAIGSHFAVTAYTHTHEYVNNLGLMKRILEPMLAEFEVDPVDDPFKFRALKTLREFKPKGLANAVRLSNQLPKPKPVKNYAIRQN
ncbi:P22AR C-terminal domain-containing protein [Lonepinella sp. BR2474]|uniref:P22AR C-terminal domain-containing protein n=1 Tax=Lonepinella sp. BR2474 TaxID=3434548 RepID=UPI003F6DCDBB